MKRLRGLRSIQCAWTRLSQSAVAASSPCSCRLQGGEKGRVRDQLQYWLEETCANPMKTTRVSFCQVIFGPRRAWLADMCSSTVVYSAFSLQSPFGRMVPRFRPRATSILTNK